jgi:sodium ion-translocating decarboxylase beta subunit
MGVLHDSVSTAEMPDVMRSLETFVTVSGAVAEVSFFRHCTANFKGGNDMEFWNAFASLFSNFGNLTWQMVVMWGIGALLIYLAIAKKMEPSLLLPMGFGAILVNLPLSGAITQGDTVGPISALFEAGMSNELFPLLLFIGIGAMIDFGPLLEKPWLMLFGAAAQFGIFFTLFLAGFFFDLKDAASIAVIGAADGPTAIFVANTLNSQYLGAIMVAAYSYMALVPIVQPPVIKLLTTQKERRIRMAYQKGSVSQLTKILFPIVVTIIAGLVAPASVALVGFLMFGNLLRECGVLNALSETAQNILANLITIVLGLTVAGQMTADKFVRPDTLLILALGLVAFVFDTAGGVLFAKLLNLFLPADKKLNPMIGAAGISAFPMSGRVVNRMGLEEDNQNFLLMYSISVNVSGQIASVIAGGLILTLMS